MWRVATGVSHPSLTSLAATHTHFRAWLLDLSREQPHHRYDGFDITPVHFPAADWLSSKNITLHVWDAFSELQQETAGVYDVVHIRTIASAIKNNNIEPLLSNLLKMLKPGGYLQWDEQYKLEARTPSADVSVEATKSIVTLQAFFSAHMNQLHYDWLDNLPATLTSQGLDVVAHDRNQACPELGRAWSDNMLTVWRGIVNFLPEQDIPLPPGMGLPEKVSRGSFAELISRSAAESTKGATAVMEQDVVVARK